MTRLAGSLCFALLVSFAPACDSGAKKDDKKAAKKDGADKGGADKGEAGKAAVKAADGGDAKVEAKPAAPVKLAELSMEDAGLDAKLQAPDGAKAAEDLGAFVVTAGESFQLQINTGAADLAASKKEIEGNTVNKLKSFVTESETELVYETEVAGKPEFHFVMNLELDGAKYNCEDKKGQAFTRADIDAMVAACKSLIPIE